MTLISFQTNFKVVVKELIMRLNMDYFVVKRSEVDTTKLYTCSFGIGNNIVLHVSAMAKMLIASCG